MPIILQSFDQSVTEAVHLLPAGLTWFMQCITLIGGPFVVITGLVILAGVAWRNDARRITFAAAAAVVGLGFNTVLKNIFHRVRPDTIYTAHMKIHSYSFPSGHAYGSTVFYGLLAYLAFRLLPKPWRLITPVVLLVLIFLIGISRIFLGAHFPSDVIAGWLLGGLTLIVIIKFIRPTYEDSHNI